jgi:RNA polymerase sigma factor (TIGR02999 family)
MRRVLVDHARRRAAAKRGANPAVGELEDWIGAEQHAPETILAVDQALSRLAEAEPRQARIVEMRFFSGLTDQEVADALKVSVRTVKRDWSLAKAWLYTQLRN